MITKNKRRLKIKKRIRKKVSGTSERPRMSVFRSNKSIYVQLIDDNNGHTLASSHSKEIESGVANRQTAFEVGKKIAQKAKDKGIEIVIFDRNGYLYHGKVKALADGAREGGLVL